MGVNDKFVSNNAVNDLDRDKVRYIYEENIVNDSCNSMPSTRKYWNTKLNRSLIHPRRLHSTVAIGSIIYCFGGYISEKETTNAVELNDVSENKIVGDKDRNICTKNNKWTLIAPLPYSGSENIGCPLVQAVVDYSSDPNDPSILIFPYGQNSSLPI